MRHRVPVGTYLTLWTLLVASLAGAGALFLALPGAPPWVAGVALLIAGVCGWQLKVAGQTVVTGDEMGFARGADSVERMRWAEVADLELGAKVTVRDHAGREIAIDPSLTEIELLINRAFVAALDHADRQPVRTSFPVAARQLRMLGGVLVALGCAMVGLFVWLHVLFTPASAVMLGLVVLGVAAMYATSPRELRVVNGQLEIVSRLRVVKIALSGARVGIGRGQHGVLAIQVFDQDLRHIAFPWNGVPAAAFAVAVSRASGRSRAEVGMLAPPLPKAAYGALTKTFMAYVGAPLLATLVLSFCLTPAAPLDGLDRARAELRSGSPPRACAEARRYAQDHPLDRAAHRLTIEAHLRTADRHGGQHGAVTDADLLVVYEPMARSADPEQRIIGQQVLAAFALDRGDLATASHDLEEARALDPLDRGLRLDLARVRFAEGRDDDARALVGDQADCESRALAFRIASRRGHLDALDAATLECVSPRDEVIAGIRAGRTELVGAALARAARFLAETTLFAVLLAAALIRRTVSSRPYGLVAFGLLVGLVFGLTLAGWDAAQGEVVARLVRAIAAALVLCISLWAIAPLLCRGRSPQARARELLLVGIAASVPLVALSGLRDSASAPGLGDAFAPIAFAAFAAGPVIVREARRERPRAAAWTAAMYLGALLVLLVCILPAGSVGLGAFRGVLVLGLALVTQHELGILAVRDPMALECPPFREAWLAIFGTACARSVLAATSLPFEMIARGLFFVTVGMIFVAPWVNFLGVAKGPTLTAAKPVSA